jgi:co-chaperonin GroES (HSP10)|tara:strand:+ start:2133 stop:2519 length:387 start_codon:yes stop_codon:yes gene_type:complete
MTVEAVKGKELEAEEPSVASQLPEPQGYKILIALPESEEKSEGGIIMADMTRRVEETASIIGFVIKMGPDCYKDEKRFPNGAYCKEGDFVIMRAYSGTRMKIHGKEFRIINDDTVEAIVQDPTGIVRV